MVNSSNTNNNLAREIDKLNENETRAVVSYISQLLSKRISKQTNSSGGDDLIKSLSDAYENKRARQVLEWEKLRRQQNFGRAA